MFRSLRSRLWLTYALVIFVTLAVVAITLLLFLGRDNPQANLVLRNAVDAIQQRSNIPFNNQSDLEGFVVGVDKDFGVRALILNKDGTMLVDSRGSNEAPIENISRPTGPQNRANINTYTDANGKIWIYSFRGLQQGRMLVVATQRQPFQEIFKSPLTDDLFRSLIRAGGLALIFSLILAYLISRWVATPLQHMSSVAKAVANGEKRQVAIKGPDEVRELGQSFNEMTHRLQASQQSQKDFVANVSHELKTPLTSIQGFAQAILDGTAATPEAQDKSAQVIFDEAGRMHRLVIDLLDLAKLDAGTANLQRAPLDMTVLLNSIGERLIPQSKEAQVVLKTEIQSLPSFIGDGDRLAQVFTNLVDNGLKHTLTGGLVILSAQHIEDKLIVKVTDNGPGIPKEEIDRIFERFYQVDKSRPGGNNARGIGLGLAIAQQIVIAHNGTLTVNSKIGHGSEFVVTLPVALSDDSTILKLRN